MCRRRAWNIRRYPHRWLLPTLTLGAWLVSGGCAQHPPRALVASPPPPSRGYVRVDALIARSPLQADVARLGAAEQQLRRLAQGRGGQSEGNGAADFSYVLGALRDIPPAAPGAVQAARRARDARSVASRSQLSQGVEAELTRYDAERARRQQQRIDQRRTELEAVDYGRAAERQRLARDAASAKVLQGIDTIATQVSIVQAKLAVLHAQLGTKNPVTGEREQGTFPPIIDKKQFDADVLSVIANPNVSFVIIPTEKDPNARHYIGMQARLEAKRILQKDLLDGLRDQLNKIHADAINSADKAALAVAQQQLDEIEHQLEMMSQDRDLAFQIRDLRVQLRNVLAAVLASENRSNGEHDRINGRADTGVGSDAAGAGSVRLQTLFGSSVALGDRAGARAAADRIAQQRARLERFIRTDVETAIKDVARERNVDIIQVSKGSEATDSAPRPSMDGRTDMTSAFARWTNLGTQQVSPVSAGSAPTPSDRTTAHPAKTPRAGGQGT